MDSDLREWILSLLRPMPHRLFCDKLPKLTSKEFERLVSDFFRNAGGVVEIGPVGANGAIDIFCRFTDGDFIIQCKKWKAKVGEATVREVYGVAEKKKVKGAFIVAASEFTKGAERFVIGLSTPVGLIDGEELFKLMNQYMPGVVADIQEGIWKSQSIL